MKDPQTSEFINLMTDFQGRLYGFILSLVADPDAANDILQDTNLVLWNKAHEFSIGTSFKSWSFRVASFQVMAYRQSKMREVLVFNDELIKNIISEQNDRADEYLLKKDKLNNCISQLPERQRALIQKRYGFGTSVMQIAEELKSTANSITQALFRARTNLVQCVKSLPDESS